MEENETPEPINLSTRQELGKVLIAAAVAFGVTKLVNRAFDQSVVAIRNYKAK